MKKSKKQKITKKNRYNYIKKSKKRRNSNKKKIIHTFKKYWKKHVKRGGGQKEDASFVAAWKAFVINTKDAKNFDAMITAANTVNSDLKKEETVSEKAFLIKMGNCLSDIVQNFKDEPKQIEFIKDVVSKAIEVKAAEPEAAKGKPPAPAKGKPPAPAKEEGKALEPAPETAEAATAANKKEIGNVIDNIVIRSKPRSNDVKVTVVGDPEKERDALYLKIFNALDEGQKNQLLKNMQYIEVVKLLDLKASGVKPYKDVVFKAFRLKENLLQANGVQLTGNELKVINLKPLGPPPPPPSSPSPPSPSPEGLNGEETQHTLTCTTKGDKEVTCKDTTA
jgi:hypothetical protein